MSVAALAVTIDREGVMDFVRGFHVETSVVLYRKRDAKLSRLYLVTKPFR